MEKKWYMNLCLFGKNIIYTDSSKAVVLLWFYWFHILVLIFVLFVILCTYMYDMLFVILCIY